MGAAMTRGRRSEAVIDRELAHLDPPLRWREWMARVEALVFASPEPVGRETLSELVGRDCNIDLVIEDIRRELKARPYDIVEVAGGFQHRTRRAYADILIARFGGGTEGEELSERETLVLLVVAYFQPITRSEISSIIGRDVSYDTLARLRRRDLVASGPRAPSQGAPVTLVTTKTFLSLYGLQGLHELPELDRLREEGLLSKERLVAQMDALRAAALPESTEEPLFGGFDDERARTDGGADPDS